MIGHFDFLITKFKGSPLVLYECVNGSNTHAHTHTHVLNAMQRSIFICND